MKCPKCQYIGFDDGNRCRNCGYEFDLAVEEPPLDVTIGRDDPAPARLPDLTLRPGDQPGDAPPAPVHDRPPRAGASASARRPLSPEDLPLFLDSVADDQAPLVSPPAVPRPPLSVRRAAPAGRERLRAPSTDELEIEDVREAERQAEARRAAAQQRTDASDLAGVGRRMAAGLIDLAVLGAITASVVYLTLRITELPVQDWQTLPLVPVTAFLLLLFGGYFVLFTAAGGQTIGKMAARIRVVSSTDGRERQRVPFGRCLMRAVACLGSVAALGAGFLPALLSPDRRAFHDRIADTRVVAA